MGSPLSPRRDMLITGSAVLYPLLWAKPVWNSPRYVIVLPILSSAWLPYVRLSGFRYPGVQSHSVRWLNIMSGTLDNIILPGCG